MTHSNTMIATSVEGADLSDCAFHGTFDEKLAGTRDFFEVYPGLRKKGQLLYASEKFILIPDIAPVTTDHLLLVPRDHVPSFSSVPSPLKSEAAAIISASVSKMQAFHPESEILAFEHGVGQIRGHTIRCGGCGRTDHAHLHLLPIPKGSNPNMGRTISEEISRCIGIEAKTFPPLPELNFGAVAGQQPYLYMWSSRMSSALLFVQASVKMSVPSQLIRRLLATEMLGVAENEPDRWDWRDYVIFHTSAGEKKVSDTLTRWRR